MKPTTNRPKLLFVTFVTVATVILSFSILAHFGRAGLISRTENKGCPDKAKENSSQSSAPLPASSTIIFESLTGHLLSINF
ncbi:hypothetical protein [Flavihumibacter sp. CACIAM 22H1]|uniref:hypothetical protein n=1 Tax=Flavihumibacter sp. CACIAM 22H1 TaxID=1812911 RepID=UPI000A98D8BF|nr:hypothetical protein [Flavihumibacter sp. CACIAM 22H1]